MKKISGFTLVELMVVITIISILSGFAVIGLTSTRQRAQDTSHLASLRDLQISLEAYKSVNGKYPDAGSQGTASYIVNLAPAFISKLPTDSVQSAASGFQYSVSSDKKSYCLQIKGTVFKPEAQPDLTNPTCTAAKSWEVCRGTNLTGITTCGVSSS